MTNLNQSENVFPGPEPSGGRNDVAKEPTTREPENRAGEAERSTAQNAGALAPDSGPGGIIPGVEGAKVMIVDDASMTLRLLRNFLEDAGYTKFVTIDRSTEAMHLLLAERPDVLLLDLNMPEVSGFDILAEARAHPETQHLPILILTASDDPDNKLRALELGATDFLAKPVDTSELALRLRNTLAAKAYQDRLIYHDALTDLPNRQLFLDRLADCLSRAQQTRTSGAVLHINLDRFKQINDSLGHGGGDRILRIIARRLAGCTREADEICRVSSSGANVSASRIGGDEFVILLPRVRDRAALNKVADRILAAVSAPIPWDDGELVITASAGVLVFPQQATSVETLLRSVVLATGRAKQLGRGRHELYSHHCEAGSAARLNLESDLHRALGRDELRLLFQPKVDVATGRVKGAEALLRWQHAERGQISPGEFIPLAEETGLIVPFGSWVLRTACEQLVQWRESGLDDFGVSVNVASLQLKEGNLLGEVRKALDATGVEPARLTLELTESAVIENAKENIETLNSIRALGVRLSLDDFGTGYSSLSYLERLPIDELKIDRSFVKKIDAAGDDAPIVNAMIAMAQRLGLRVVAEGVETEAQRNYLKRHRCDLYQGYLFAKPLPPEECAERARAADEAIELHSEAMPVAEPVPANGETGASPQRHANVLLIDDDSMLCNLISTLLAEDDVSVTAAYTGGAGLKLAREQSFDLILLDVGLPDTDGFSLCTELCTDAAVSGVPVVFLTSRETPEDEVRGLNAGAVDFIRKPVHADILRLRVRNQLELKMHRDRLAQIMGQREVSPS